MSKQSIPLNLGVNYVSHWGMWQAVRELLQNALDAGQWDIQYDTEAETLTIISRGGELSLDNLILGGGDKQNNLSSRGMYCEGLKLAILVLVRLDKKISIETGHNLWEPTFKRLEGFTEPSLFIETTYNSECFEDLTDSVRITVEGVTSEEYEEICDKTLVLKDSSAIRNIIAEHNGTTVFEEEVPRVYVGGLYVCDLYCYWGKYKYSYDINPADITLDRDRNTVNEFSVTRIATDTLVGAESWFVIADLANEEYLDLDDRNCYSPTDQEHVRAVLAKAAERAFFKKHGGKAQPLPDNYSAVEEYHATQDIINAGMKPVKVSRSLYAMMSDKVKEQRITGQERESLYEKLVKLKEYSENVEDDYLTTELEECIVLAKIMYEDF